MTKPNQTRPTIKQRAQAVAICVTTYKRCDTAIDEDEMNIETIEQHDVQITRHPHIVGHA